MRTLVLSLLAVALAGTATAAADPDATRTLVVKLDRQGCYGTCPMYSISVFDDGSVEWKGTGFVKVHGTRALTVDQDAVAALTQQFVDAKFAKLPKYIGCTKTDQAVARLTFVVNGKKKSVTHESCGTGTKNRATAEALEKAVDDLAGAEKLIGAQSERDMTVD